jgi:hypothetical protein
MNIVDQHRLCGPDPNFHVEAVPDPDWHQNDADPHADPTPSLINVGKSYFFLLLPVSMFYLSHHQCQR